MKSTIKTIVYATLLFAFFMSIFFSLITLSLFKGIIKGTLSGILFGIFIGIFMFFQNKKFKRLGLEITNGKEIIYNGPANHFTKSEAAGGWLFLTKDELIFQSHKYNLKPHQTIIKLSDIKELKKKSIAKLIRKGLEIETVDGREEVFVVNNLDEWIRVIEDVKI